MHPANGDAPDVVGPVERGHEHLKRLAQFNVRAGDFFQDQVHQRLDAVAGLGRIVGGVAQLRAGEKIGEIGQNVVGAELQEQFEHLIDDLVGPRVGPVDLVDDHDRPQPALKRLRQNEPRLGHRPLGGIDQHQRAVGHPQHPLHFAAEIGVAGRVDDVDFDALIGDGDVFGKDRDASLAFQVVGIEDLLADKLRSRNRPL